MVLKKSKDMSLVYNHRSQRIKYLAREPLLLYRLCREICNFFKFFEISRANSSFILIFSNNQNSCFFDSKILKKNPTQHCLPPTLQVFGHLSPLFILPPFSAIDAQ